MPDDRHEARRAIAAWKVARYERKLTLAISAALAAQRAKLARFTPGTPPPDPLDLATWQETVNQHVEPAARSVLSEIARDVGKAAGLGVGVGILSRGSQGVTVQDLVNEGAATITKQASGIVERLAPRASLVISTATDNGALADSMNGLFNAADVQASLVARSANFFANALAQQAALTVTDESPLQKTWITMGDDRVRPDHEDVDGTTLPADEAFDVGGESLMYPGDPQGSEAEVANCRCWLAFEPAANANPAQVQATEDSLAAAAIMAPEPRRGHTLRVDRIGLSQPHPPRNRSERRSLARRKR